MAPGDHQHFGDQPGNQQHNNSSEDRFLHSRLHFKRRYEIHPTPMLHLRLNDALADTQRAVASFGGFLTEPNVRWVKPK
jgi:hypothetical protein